MATELTWDAEGFAVAGGYDEQTGRYVGLMVPHEDAFGQVTDQSLLVRPEVALAQRDRERADRAAAAASAAGSVAEAPVAGGVLPGGSAGSTGTSTVTGAGTSEPNLTLAGPKNTRFFGVARLNPERYARDLTRLSQEIIQHLAAPEGVELEVRIEAQAIGRQVCSVSSATRPRRCASPRRSRPARGRRRRSSDASRDRSTDTWRTSWPSRRAGLVSRPMKRLK